MRVAGWVFGPGGVKAFRDEPTDQKTLLGQTYKKMKELLLLGGVYKSAAFQEARK